MLDMKYKGEWRAKYTGPDYTQTTIVLMIEEKSESRYQGYITFTGSSSINSLLEGNLDTNGRFVTTFKHEGMTKHLTGVLSEDGNTLEVTFDFEPTEKVGNKFTFTQNP